MKTLKEPLKYVKLFLTQGLKIVGAEATEDTSKT